jgi:hypothetical protein
MRGGVAAVALLALLVAAPHVGAGPPVSSMTAAASPHTAGAHAVRITLTLRYEMQCGYAGAGPLVVTFPRALKLPKRFAAGAVKLAGKRAAPTVRGRHVTVTIPRHKGPLCGLIAPGSVTLTFTRTAKLVNPRRPGSYRLTSTHEGFTFTAALAIDPAG